MHPYTYGCETHDCEISGYVNPPARVRCSIAWRSNSEGFAKTVTDADYRRQGEVGLEMC